MGNRLDPGFGLLIPEELFSSDTEASQGAGSTDSSYTQADPGPGQPVAGDASSSWRPRVGAYQDRDCDAIVLRGGWPGRDRTGRPAASVAVRVAGSAATEFDYVGWDEPVTPRGWTSAPSIFGAAAQVELVASCVVPSTQVLVLLTCDSSGANRVLSTFDPRQETWTENASVLAGVTLPSPIALAFDEERDRMLLFAGSDGDAYGEDTICLFSDDGGATWATYARGQFDEATSNPAGRISVAPQPQRPWCMFRSATGGGYSQWSSIDRGVSWQRVDHANAVLEGASGVVVPLRSGAFLVVYIANTSKYLNTRRVSSADSPFGDVDDVTVTTDETVSFAVDVDADGVVYLFSTRVVTPKSRIAAWRSLDEGLTWEAYTYDVANPGVDGAFPALWAAHCVAGEVDLVQTLGNGDADLLTSVGVLRTGGWSSVEAGVGDTGVWSRLERHGFGTYHGSASLNDGNVWYPVETPENFGWLPGVAGGTVSFVTTNGCGLRVQTTAAQHYWAQANVSSSGIMCGELELAVRTGDTTTLGPGAKLIMSDGATYEYEVDLYLGATAIRVVDTNGALDEEDTGLDTSAGVYVRWQMTQRAGLATLSVWYRLPGRTAWTQLCRKSALTSDGSPGTFPFDEVLWGPGINGAVTSDSVWRLVGIAWDSDWLDGIEDAGDLLDTPRSEGHLGLAFGRALPSDLTYPCPVPALTTYASGSPTDCPRLSAVGGPARASETTSLPTAYAQPFSRIYPISRQLSPRRGWLGTSTAEHRVVWDLGGNQDLAVGAALGLCVIGSLARQVALEYWTGAAWTTAGTLDLSISAGTALNCTRAGRTVVPRAGSAAVARYWAEGALVGGYAILSAGAGFVARPILRQSAGYWDTAAHQQLSLVLDGVDGTEDAAGTVDIVAPGGVLIVYLTAAQVRRKWRVRWPSGQVVPGSAYGAGKVLAGRVLGVGADPGWDWSRRLEFRRELERDRAGQVDSIRELAPPGQVWSYGWTEGLLLRTLRSSTTPNYVAASGGLAIGTSDDAISLLGLFEHRLQSGALPCVILPRLTSSTGTVLDPTMWRYGVLASDNIGITGIAGTEGVDEYIRLDAATFEEVR